MRVDHSPARIAAYNAQRGRCYYCCNLMWERQLESKNSAARRVWRFHHARQYEGLPEMLADSWCTAEHLHRQAEGGQHENNIVASCRYCNSHRGETPLAEWRALMWNHDTFERGGTPLRLVFVRADLADVAQWVMRTQGIRMPLKPGKASLRVEHLLTAIRDEPLLFPPDSPPLRLPGSRVLLQQGHVSFQQHFASTLVR